MKIQFVNTIFDDADIYTAMLYILPQMRNDIYNTNLSFKKRKQRMRFVHAADEFLMAEEQYFNQRHGVLDEENQKIYLLNKYQKWIDCYNAIEL